VNLRLRYLVATIVTIGAGLLCRMRKHWFPDVINLYLGDTLYAVMMYFVMAFLFPLKSAYFKAFTALAICFAIELSQLYHSPFVDALRNTLFGRLVLGSGFLWSDLLAYTIGVLFAVAIDSLFLRNRAQKNRP
jgi:hypothetical protein